MLAITWKPLYISEFGDDEKSRQKDSLAAFQREIHGIDFDKMPWQKKFAVRWAARRAAEKKKNFQVMSSLLSSLGLSKYAPVFEAEEIDLESLCLMNAGHLRDLGIPAGPRMKLLNAAACLADLTLEDDDEETRPSIQARPSTQVSKFKERQAKMKQMKVSLVRRVQQSAVRIAILTSEGQLCNVGSGIIIHENGLIATARHCLQGEQFDSIYSDDFMVLIAPTESPSTPPLWKYHAKAIPECCDEELDYALLRVDCEVISDPPSGLYLGDVTDRTIARNWTVTKIEGTSAGTIPKLPAVPIGNSNNMEPGDEMWMFGYPSSGHNTITVHHAICSGTDSQLYNGVEVDKAMLRTAAQLDNGFSGGAAVDKKGQLVGLISFSVLRQDRVRAINMVKGAIEFAKRKYILKC
jgi:S1-C subfamily serine protease